MAQMFAHCKYHSQFFFFLLISQVPVEQEGENMERLLPGGEGVCFIDWPFCKTHSHSRRRVLAASASLSMFCLFFQEASTQESRWEGNGPGGKLSAKIPEGEGLVPESRISDFMPTTGTGTWPAWAKKGRLFNFQQKKQQTVLPWQDSNLPSVNVLWRAVTVCSGMHLKIASNFFINKEDWVGI